MHSLVEIIIKYNIIKSVLSDIFSVGIYLFIMVDSSLNYNAARIKLKISEAHMGETSPEPYPPGGDAVRNCVTAQ